MSGTWRPSCAALRQWQPQPIQQVLFINRYSSVPLLATSFLTSSHPRRHINSIVLQFFVLKACRCRFRRHQVDRTWPAPAPSPAIRGHRSRQKVSPGNLSIFLYIYISFDISIYPSVYQSVYLSIYLSIYL